MSEVKKAQPPLFESDAPFEPLGEYDDDQEFIDLYHAIAEKFYLDPELARLGTMWGVSWWRALQSATISQHDGNERFTWSAVDLLAVRDSVAASLSLPIPKDSTENRPTFRVQFAAHEAFYAVAGMHGDACRTTLDGDGPGIVPNFERIDYVFSALLDSYNRKLYPYNLDSTRVPQDLRHMPRNLETDVEKSTEQQKIQLASFWFADCYYMRGVNNSNDMTINLAKLYEDHPEIFDFAKG